MRTKADLGGGLGGEFLRMGVCGDCWNLWRID